MPGASGTSSGGDSGGMIRGSVNAGGVSAGSDGISVSAGGVSVGSDGVSVAGMPTGTGGMGSTPGSNSGTSGAGTGTGAIPGSGSGNSSVNTGGVMTASERVAVLDGQLGRGYEDFDGLILAERGRAQRQSNEVGADPAGLYEGAGGTGAMPGVAFPGEGQGTPGAGGDGGMPSQGGLPAGVIIAGAGEGGPQGGGSGGSMGGRNGGPTSAAEGAFPVPDDIPSGRDDDVVARQIREAAMNEADPELRERLWDEYRRYTGLSE